MARYPTAKDYRISGAAGTQARVTSVDRILRLVPRLVVPLGVVVGAVLLIVDFADWQATLLAEIVYLLGAAVVYLAGQIASRRMHRSLADQHSSAETPA